MDQQQADGEWRLFWWSPIASPIAAGLILLFWPAAWWGFFGKETTSEHLTHFLLALAVFLFITRYLRESRRIPGDFLFAIGSLVVLVEETDYGLLYLRHFAEVPDIENQSFHNTTVGIALFLALPICFASVPFLFTADSTVRRRWFPVPRATAASVGVCVLFLLASQPCPVEVGGYLVREGADEVHDLGVALALLVTALRPRRDQPVRG